jgi:hypothetical protein
MSPRDSTLILPQLVVSMTAISGIRPRRSEAILCMTRDCPSGVIRGHGPSFNALRAATARSTSSTPAFHAPYRFVRGRADGVERLASGRGNILVADEQVVMVELGRGVDSHAEWSPGESTR